MSVLNAAPGRVQGGGLAEGLDLVVRFQAGDPEAFADIYRFHYSTVFRYVMFRAKGVQLAEDLTQDVFVKALRRLPSFEVRDTALAGWLVTIARNLIIDHFKSSNTRLCVAVGGFAEASGIGLGWSLPAEAAADDQVLRHLESVDLLTLVLQLTDLQQDVIILRFLQGRNVRETAQQMGLTEAAVKAQQLRAVRSLARLIGRRGWR